MGLFRCNVTLVLTYSGRTQLSKNRDYRKRRDKTGMKVCPAKAGAFSGKQTRQGKSQDPVAWIVRRKETES